MKKREFTEKYLYRFAYAAQILSTDARFQNSIAATYLGALRDELIDLASKTDADLYHYIVLENTKYANALDARGLFKKADHITSRLGIWRKNLDLDEGWNKIMDDFREGKISGLGDVIKKKRKKKA